MRLSLDEAVAKIQEAVEDLDDADNIATVLQSILGGKAEVKDADDALATIEWLPEAELPPAEPYVPEVATTFAEVQAELAKMTAAQLAEPLTICDVEQGRYRPAQLSVVGVGRVPAIVDNHEPDHPARNRQLSSSPNTGDEMGDWKGDESRVEAQEPPKCTCPSVACQLHGLPPGSASGGW